jgi:hypothetical protein
VKYQVQTENTDVVSRPEKPAVAQEEVQPCSRFAVHRDKYMQIMLDVGGRRGQGAIHLVLRYALQRLQRISHMDMIEILTDVARQSRDLRC